MKLEKLLDQNNKFTDLVRITDFTSVEDCLEIFKKYFKCDYFWTENTDEKNYKYAYISGDCQVYFVEKLDEFNYSRSEEDWKVNNSIEITQDMSK